MKRLCIFSLVMTGFLVACATTTTTPPTTQLQVREFQTRSYETNDAIMVMKAALNVLQDDGFIVKNAEAELGLITAQKEVDIENKGEAFIALLFAGQNARWSKNDIIECSCNVSAFGNETRVRVNFQLKRMNNKGEVVVVKQVDDATYYQNFFSKMDKGVFIQKEKL
jgi:hypothetical protein